MEDVKQGLEESVQNYTSHWTQNLVQLSVWWRLSRLEKRKVTALKESLKILGDKTRTCITYSFAPGLDSNQPEESQLGQRLPASSHWGTQLVFQDQPEKAKYVCLVAQSCLTEVCFATPWTVAHQAPLSMGSPRQEHWSGLPFPSPGDLLNPGSEPEPPQLWADSLLSEPPEAQYIYLYMFIFPDQSWRRTNLSLAHFWLPPEAYPSLLPSSSLLCCLGVTAKCKWLGLSAPTGSKLWPHHLLKF